MLTFGVKPAHDEATGAYATTDVLYASTRSIEILDVDETHAMIRTATIHEDCRRIVRGWCIDLIQASADLGATPAQAFMRVTLPLSRPSIMAGAALVVLPMFGDYYTNDLISASPKTSMLGNEINLFVLGGNQQPLGASLVLVLMILLGIGMAYYLYATLRDARRLA